MSRDAELLDEVGDAHRPGLLDQAEDGRAALAGEHAHSSRTTAAARGPGAAWAADPDPGDQVVAVGRDLAVLVGVVEQEEPAALARAPANDLDAGGEHRGRRDPQPRPRPVSSRAPSEPSSGRVLRYQADAVPGGAPGDGRPPGRAGRRRRSSRTSASTARASSLHSLPGAAVGQRDGLGHPQREELLDADAEQVAERSRVAAEPHVVVGVADARRSR